MNRPTALIADDEPLLREQLAAHAGAALARAAGRGPGAQRPRGGRAVRRAAAAGRVSRCPHAGHQRRRGGALHRPACRGRVRHRVRPVRRPGVPPGRDRLHRQAGRARAPARLGAAPAGSAARRRRRPATRVRGLAGAHGQGIAPARERDRGTCSGSRPRSATRFASSASSRSLYLRSDAKYTAGRLGGRRGADPHARCASSPMRSTRAASCRCIARRSST